MCTGTLFRDILGFMRSERIIFDILSETTYLHLLTTGVACRRILLLAVLILVSFEADAKNLKTKYPACPTMSYCQKVKGVYPFLENEYPSYRDAINTLKMKEQNGENDFCIKILMGATSFTMNKCWSSDRDRNAQQNCKTHGCSCQWTDTHFENLIKSNPKCSVDDLQLNKIRHKELIAYLRKLRQELGLEPLSKKTRPFQLAFVIVEGKVVDNKPPWVTLAGGMDDRYGRDTRPEFSGTAEPQSVVMVNVDGRNIAQIKVTDSALWSVGAESYPSSLSEGPHVVEVYAIDDANNRGQSRSMRFIVDTKPPVVSVLNPVNSGYVSELRPIIEGTAEPGSVLSISIDDVLIGKTKAGEDGAWFLGVNAYNSDLSEGFHKLEITAHDPAGNHSQNPYRSSFRVDKTAPWVKVNRPRFDRPLKDKRVAFSGMAQIGSTVTIRVDGKDLAVVQTDDKGEWLAEAPVDERSEPYKIEFFATDSAGNSSSAELRHLRVDRTPPVVNLIQPASPLYIKDRMIVFEGESEPASEVEVSVDRELLGKTRVNNMGRWRLDASSELREGRREVLITAVDEAGNVSKGMDLIITLDRTAPEIEIDQPNTRQPLRGMWRPRIEGTCSEPGSTVMVEVDGERLASVETNDQGAWLLDPKIYKKDLSPGKRKISLRARDRAGNEGHRQYEFTIEPTVVWSFDLRLEAGGRAYLPASALSASAEVSLEPQHGRGRLGMALVGSVEQRYGSSPTLRGELRYFVYDVFLFDQSLVIAPYLLTNLALLRDGAFGLIGDVPLRGGAGLVVQARRGPRAVVDITGEWRYPFSSYSGTWLTAGVGWQF